MGRKRVTSGMRPTGSMHLGNLLGALDNWVRLQDDYDCFFFIVDWHALTTPGGGTAVGYENVGDLRNRVREIAVDWIAAGLDPGKCSIFIQSHVPEVAELHLLFSMITPLGWLERNPAYRDMVQSYRIESPSYGLLGYPTLQAADILAYKGDYVPVGKDQEAHVNMTRDLGQRFNSLYGKKVFPITETLLTPVPKVPGLDSVDRKMSKSSGNYIAVSDSAEETVAKIRSMYTDPVKDQEGRSRASGRMRRLRFPHYLQQARSGDCPQRMRERGTWLRGLQGAARGRDERRADADKGEAPGTRGESGDHKRDFVGGGSQGGKDSRGNAEGSKGRDESSSEGGLLMTDITDFFIDEFRKKIGNADDTPRFHRPRPYRNAAVRFRKCSIEDFETRRDILVKEAGLNVFLFRADMIPGCDLLSDSGTTTMTMEQWAAMMLGDEAYGSNEGYFELKDQIAETFGPDWVETGTADGRLFGEPVPVPPGKSRGKRLFHDTGPRAQGDARPQARSLRRAASGAQGAHRGEGVGAAGTETLYRRFDVHHTEQFAFRHDAGQHRGQEDDPAQSSVQGTS